MMLENNQLPSEEKMNSINPINKRKLINCILLSVFTFGIYAIYWQYLLVKNIRTIKKDDTSCVKEMLCLTLIPYYSIYWWFTRGKFVHNEFSKQGFSSNSNEIAFLILSIFGLGIVAMAIMQNDFNSLPFEAANIELKIKWKKYINYVAVALFIIITSICSSDLKFGTRILFENIAINIILAVSLGLVIGFLGELSLGHAGFMCIGAYIGGKVALLLRSSIQSSFVLLMIAIIVGGLAAALCGVLIGLPALRLKGDYLAIVTLAFGEIVRTVFLNIDFFGGTSGLKTDAISYDKKTLFIIAFVIVLIMLAVIQNLIASKHGRAITAIRDSEIAAKATGINVTFYKIFVFSLSAFFAGVAGVLYAFRQNPTSEVFSYNKSIEILVMVVLGGMGNINGSIVSATLITYLNTKLQLKLSGDKAVFKNIFYSLILIAIVVYNNAPKLKNFRDKYNLKNLIKKIFKNKEDAGVIKNDEGKWNRIPTKINMDEVLSTDVVVKESVVSPDKGDTK